MEKLKMICFDMDGTIANLYGVHNWLEHLRNENEMPYQKACPMWDMDRLTEALFWLKTYGIEIRIITWLAKDSTADYKHRTRVAKLEWLEKMGFPFDNFHGVQYGTTKADCVRKYLADDETAILIDDNDKVRNGWHLGETINPTNCDLIETLYGILEKVIEK